MPRRRSRRLKEKSNDAEESNKNIDNSIKTKEIESVSNDNTLQVNQTQNNKKLEIEETEQKDFSEPQSVEASREQSRAQSVEKSDEPSTEPEQAKDPQPANDEKIDDEQSDEEEAPETLISTRSRRNVKRMSYKDDSSSEEEGEEDDDPMFAGLSKEQKQAMKEKMAAIQKGANESTLKERALKIQEIIGTFEINLDAEVTEEEAAFIYDFSRKHQFDVIEKIEDEGDFFLDSMREMIEEKLKLHEAGIRGNGGKRKRRKKDEESESEFDMNDFDDESDSEYSMDSEFENPFEDNENMIDEYEDDEDYAAWGDKKRRGKRRRNKNIWRDESGREYYAKGRLLLTDALKDTVNFEGWSAARVKAWKNKEVNPNAYHYRFNLPGEEAVNGPLRESEIKPFMERVKEVGVNVHWGTFSQVIKGRVGYQCSNYWRQMMKDGWVKDPNYWILPDGKFAFKRGKKHDIPTNIRKYAFVVLKDPSGTFGPDFPAFHPKRPSDKQLKKYLETDVKDLDEGVKAGKKKKSKGRGRGRGKGKKDEDDKNEVDETTDNNQEEKEENEEGEKSKKKTSKKKKDKKKKNKKKKNKTKDGQEENEGNDDEDNEENEESKDKKTKKKKKSKKAKKSSKKDKKKKDKKSKKKSKKDKKSKKSKKDKKGEETENDDNNNNTDEKEGESESTTNSAKRGKKRKHSGGEPSELEPPQKKRKKMNKKSKTKNKNKKESEKEDEEEMDVEQDALSLVLGDMNDIMTGDKLVDPAISPYGYVMSYSSWCSILRNSKTKNQCPFTKQKLTRRSLVKLTVDNIEQYKDEIVNITEEEAKKFKF